MTLTCIVHYSDPNGTYSKLKSLTDVNKERIIQAKHIRESIRGENYHENQCLSVPETFDDCVHGIHLDPCYKKFTKILSSKHVEREPVPAARRSVRSGGSGDSVDDTVQLFPKECFVCGKYRLQKSKQDEYPIVITTIQAANTIKMVAGIKKPVYYLEIKDVDLIAKELRYHPSCNKNFTRGFNEQSRESEQLFPGNVPDEVQRQGDYESVKDYIKKHILEEKEAVSISVLQTLYGLGSDTRYRSKLKSRIQKDFPNKLEFLSVGRKAPEILIDASVPVNEMAFKDKDGCIVKCAEYLREEIIKYSKNLPELNWPPSLEELNQNERTPPQSLLLFLKHILKTDSSQKTEANERFINSFAADIIAAVTRGKTITAKQFLLALGLHNITGQRKAVEIVNRLGHCLTYNTTCEIETALAEKAQQLSLSGSTLPLRAADNNSYVLTVFWVDNFDVKVERQTGSTSLNTTHMVAFQEKCQKSVFQTNNITVGRTRKRKLSSVNVNSDRQCYVNPKVEPSLFTSDTTSSQLAEAEAEEVYKSSIVKYFLWLWIRKQNNFDQLHPSFSGWLVRHRKSDELTKTVLSYLPPINSKVTEFKTIVTYLEYLQMVSNQTNMRYVNVTLDVGAAINAFKTVWHYPEKFKNVVIHLGDFHFMKENFQVIGNLITGSGWEDVVFQAGLSSTGSVMAVLSGSHYNRAWLHHSIVSEAMERLLIQRFIYDTKQKFPDSMTEFSVDVDGKLTDNLLANTKKISTSYESFRGNVRDGNLGKTAQFWLIYLDLMRMQHFIHTAVQENDFNLRFHAWEYFIPFYFAFNKTNYARYGSFYLETMRVMETRFPGLKEILKDAGLSVQGQERYPLRISVDQRGEQTINRDAKTTGGIKAFSVKEELVLKWCLNRSEQAKNTQDLREMCGLVNDPGIYKPSRPSQISKSEHLVQSVMHVLVEEYINPFGFDVEKDELVSLSSGTALNPDATNFLLSIKDEGKQKHQEFLENRLKKNDVAFHDPIKRVKILNFNSAAKKTLTK